MLLVVNLQEAQALEGQLQYWAYSALDATGTREIADTLLPMLNERTARTYAFERALQAPAMSMMFRGVRVDTVKRAAMVTELKRELRKDENGIAKMPLVTDKWDRTELETGFCPKNVGKHHKWPKGVPDAERTCAHCGTARVKPKPFEPNSSPQAMHLFYELHGTKKFKNKKGEPSVDDDALAKIGYNYAALRPLTDAIRSVRDKVKQLGSLEARLSPDGRYHSSFNVGAAWTGRFSSSSNPFGLGGNLQNVAPRHRSTFIGDPGLDIGYSDYMQGESNIVAHLSGDPRYIEAHALGDVHTYVTRFVWPELDWTGDLARDKKVAKQLPPWDPVEGHDFRFQCKRIQHGSNYGMTPAGISLTAHIPLKEAKVAYERYMTEFEHIPAWQGWVANEIAQGHPLVNALGREVYLFGRPHDKHTWRQGLAFLPQSLLADIEDIALWLIWKELEEHGLELMAQVHDAMLEQHPRDRLDLVHAMLKLMAVPVPITDFRGTERIMTIGVEAAVGRNWGHKSDANPYGINEI